MVRGLLPLTALLPNRAHPASAAAATPRDSLLEPPRVEGITVDQNFVCLCVYVEVFYVSKSE